MPFSRAVEQGNQLVEQRNDAFKSSTAAAHAKVLELEQEKVTRTQELHELTSKFGAVQVNAFDIECRCRFP